MVGIIRQRLPTCSILNNVLKKEGSIVCFIIFDARLLPSSCKEGWVYVNEVDNVRCGNRVRGGYGL